jgi:hypothetical protein
MHKVKTKEILKKIYWREFTMAEQTGTTTWPELGMSLYEALTGKGAEITYEFNNLEVYVPSAASASAVHAKWIINGIMKIRTKETK